ncbi:hypothetical protein MJ749_25315 [Paenibacillus polymyxa]|uniref:hypothetical protein n=1 Tax=Paenibacillus polymyxa TaxID=1406 RepID=UPI001F10680A|nr:hypothetical protein [Paenibacillus polymyxa]UMR35902.1 hypothetical protein MJ749_25315 [Paenibacillus polymyxa]WCM62720.1 hypothetical protein OYT09_07190 [Paenibacillus polymyxa]
MTERNRNPLPNDKVSLLDDPRGFEVYNRDLVRKVFPRIINETLDTVYAGSRRKPEIRDIVAFYFTLQSYIDGNHLRSDGTLNDRFGACFISYETLMSTLRIDRSRIKLLADILETNGIIRTVTRYEGTRRFKWYFPSYCPRITDDGYIVDEDGAIIEPDMSLYSSATHRKARYSA